VRLLSVVARPAALLVGATAAGASTAVAFAADEIRGALDHPGRFLGFLVATVLLQLLALKVPGRGSVGVSAVGLVGAAIALGTGPAMAIAVVCALAQWLRSRGLAHRALFDAANMALAAGAAGLVFDAVVDADSSGFLTLVAAVLAGLAYTTVNHGLLCLAMGLSESRSPLAVWSQRFHWARYHFLAFGALGLLAATADAALGAFALVAFVVPAVLLALSMRESLGRFRQTTTRDIQVFLSQ
jgi:hypothetical protein